MILLKRILPAGLTSTKTVFAACLFSAAFLCSCAGPTQETVQDRVGPASSTATGRTGYLVVYSALDAGAHFSSLPYRDHYTDYKLLSESGTLLQVVHNQDGNTGWRPRRVELPAGNYQIVAAANGHRLVRLPVRVVAGQITPVHLEGGAGRRWGAPQEPTEAVRLADGQTIGWRCGEAATQSVLAGATASQTSSGRKQ